MKMLFFSNFKEFFLISRRNFKVIKKKKWPTRNEIFFKTIMDFSIKISDYQNAFKTIYDISRGFNDLLLSIKSILKDMKICLRFQVE